MNRLRDSMVWSILRSIKRKYRYIKYEKYCTQIKGYFRNKDFFESNKKRIYVVTTPEYGNLGDHAIALSEINILKSAFPEAEIIEIVDSQFWDYYLGLRYNIKKQDMICLIGGGNMGWTYPETEYVRRKVIAGCKNNRVIMFPQTMDFGTDADGQRELNKTIKIYNSNKNLWLLAREQRSYMLMKTIFANCHVELCPDVVLSNKFSANTDINPQQITLCMRSDCEKSISNEIIEAIKNLLNELGYYVVMCDTEKGCSIRKHERLKEISKVIDIFVGSRCVITDRLHGMILAHISGVPCLAFDNKNKKISGVCEWIKDDEGVFMCTNPSEWEKKLRLLLEVQHFNYNPDTCKRRFIAILRQADSSR